MVHRCDILVIGGGALGLASAHYLKASHPKLDILLIDRMPGAGQGNTAKSAAMIRNTFSSQTNLALTDSTIDFFIEVERSGFPLGLELMGYLWLMTEGQAKANNAAIAQMRNHQIPLRLLDGDDLRAVPQLRTSFSADDPEAAVMGLEGITLGLFGPKCGAIEPDRLVQYYEQRFLAAGGRVRYGAAVASLLLEPSGGAVGLPGEPLVWQDKRITGAKLADGSAIMAQTVVLCTGTWANQLLDPLGVDCHMKPKTRQLFSIPASEGSLAQLLHTRGFNDLQVVPFLILPRSGIYVKPVARERHFWIGCSDGLGRAYALEDDPQAEEGFFNYSLSPVLSAYLPQFAGQRPDRMWAGQYAYSTIDRNPFVFAEAGALVATGDSGSGIMKADAIGRMVAALYDYEILGEKAADHVELFNGRTLPVDCLSLTNRSVQPERFVI